jgi:hypothetical protein
MGIDQIDVGEESECRLVCRFSDAGNDEARHTLGGQRRKGARETEVTRFTRSPVSAGEEGWRDGEAQHPLTDEQTVGRLNITTAAGPTTLDDTAFAPSQPSCLLVADAAGNTVYRVDNAFGFEPGTAYSISDTAGIIGVIKTY